MNKHNTPCECPLAGWCERHKMQKIGRLHHLCQTNIDYFNRWEHVTKQGPSKRNTRAMVKPDLIAEKGRKLWGELHSYQWENEKDAKEWLRKWKKRIPRFGCGCHKHFSQICEQAPPDFSSAEAFAAWGIRVHNLVNASLNKPQWPYKE